nr:unnamed protein product [Naegleria fowleri]
MSSLTDSSADSTSSSSRDNTSRHFVGTYWTLLIHQLKIAKRQLLENEKSRKLLQQTKEFYAFALEFSKQDLIQFLQDRMKIVFYCFIAGLLIGFFLLSHSHANLSQQQEPHSSHPRNSFSFPLPEGFHPDTTSQHDLNLLRHFFMVSSRSLLSYEGGNIDAFDSKVLKSSNLAIATSGMTIQNLDPTLFFKNFTLKSKPLLLEKACAGWKAKREWTNIQYLQSSVDASTQILVEKSKNDLIYGTVVPGQTTQFETTLQHDIPKWPFLFSNGFYSHISTHLIMMSHELATRLKLNLYETLHCQFVGSSSFLLYDPFQLDLLYSNQQNPLHIEFNPYHPDFELHPLSKFARSLHAELKEGDCLFIPSFWIYSHKTHSHNQQDDATSLNIGVQYQYSPVSTAQRVAFESVRQ